MWIQNVNIIITIMIDSYKCRKNIFNHQIEIKDKQLEVCLFEIRIIFFFYFSEL